MSLVSNTDLATPLTDDQARRAEQLNPLLRRTVALRRIAQLEANLNTLTADQALEQFGQVPFNTLAYSNVPTDTNTVTIGADVYEFCTAAGSVASDTNIAVVIGTSNATAQNLVDAINATLGSGPVHPTLFQTDGVTPAVASGTENVLAVYVAGTIYVYNADAPGGTKVDGVAPSLAFSDTADNYGPWMYSNLNLSIGAAFAPVTKVARLKHALVAGDLTETMPLRIPVPFAPQSYELQVRDASGVAVDRYCAVSVPTAVSGQNFVGIDVNPTSPTTVRSFAAVVPLVANATSTVSWAIPTGAKTTGISAKRGASALGSTLGTITLAVKNGAGTTMLNAASIDAEVLTGSFVAKTVTATGADLVHAAGDVLTFELVSNNADATGEYAVVEIFYIEPAIATDVVHLNVFGA